MKKISLILIVLSIGFISQAQLAKGNWMIGGNATYSKNDSKGTDAVNSKTRIIDILGNIGYFPLPKFATGLILNTVFAKEKTPQPDGTYTTGIQNNLGAGIFIRYYFLKQDNRINVFLTKGWFIRYINRKAVVSNSTMLRPSVIIFRQAPLFF